MPESDKQMVLQLPRKWANHIHDQPESGMSYHIITIALRDGRRFERVPYCAGYIDLKGLPGFQRVPFTEEDIAEIVVTHDRSGPPRLAK
jgi:hypothetical protein